MHSLNIKRVHEVPRSVDEEGHVWYRCLSDMHFATARVGWAVGSTQILHTRDGGKTWVNQFKECEESCYLTPHNLFAIGPEACWIIAISSPTEIRCCYTQDGGETWKGKQFESEVYPNDIFFLDSKRGWLVSDDGRVPGGAGKIHFTKDGGENWETRHLEMEGKPARVRFYNAKKGWSIEHYVNQDRSRTYTRLHQSDDGGFSWRMVKRFDRRIFGSHALDENHIFVIGESGFVAGTTDGGLTWQRKKTGIRANVNAINYWNSKLALAACDFGTLLLTQDGGETWEKLNTPSGTGNLLGAHFSSESRGILASDSSILLFDLSR